MKMIEVNLKLLADTPSSMTFEDTYEGLKNPWYKIETDEHGNIELTANREGFEHLARMLLKFARGNKTVGYHSHHSTELGRPHEPSNPEWTISLIGKKDA